MEQSFEDLLSNAFSGKHLIVIVFSLFQNLFNESIYFSNYDLVADPSVLSFTDEDLDFENLNFDEKLEEDRAGISHNNIPTKENKALHQEVTAVLSSMEAKDASVAENVNDDELSDEASFQGVEVIRMDESLEEDYASSDGDSVQEDYVSGEDEEEEEEEGMRAGEESGELLMVVRCDEFCNGNKEDKVFAEGQPLAPEGDENPQVRNQEQGDSESDEELSYFRRVPEHDSGMRIKGDGNEEDVLERGPEKQDDSSDSDGEAMKTEGGRNVLTLCFEQEAGNPHWEGRGTASLEHPDGGLSVQSLQGFGAEVNSEKDAERIKDFSGEEHQEAGESFADYPSDFSSCEYVDYGGKTQESDPQSAAKQDVCPGRAEADLRRMGMAKDSDEEYLFSIDLEVAASMFSGLDVGSGEKDKGKTEFVEQMWGGTAVMGYDKCESDSYSSSDDEAHRSRSDEELCGTLCPQDLEKNKQLEELHRGSSALSSMWSTCDKYCRADPAEGDVHCSPNASAAQTLLSDDLFTTEEVDMGETLPSIGSLCHAAGVSPYSVTQRWDTDPSNQGSLDDSFFFNTELEASGITELGELGDDEYEERNWEQEQERIRAFYEFYDESDEQNEKEGE